jgi:U6 snRNA-associated Sm-like protein LSm6
MNIALEKAEEYIDGAKRRTYGDAFVRGNNGKIESSPPHGPMFYQDSNPRYQSCMFPPTHEKYSGGPGLLSLDILGPTQSCSLRYELSGESASKSLPDGCGTHRGGL